MMLRCLALLLCGAWLGACTEVPEHVQGWGSEGSELGEFREPFDIAVDSEGFVYVADVRNQRIQKFDVQGRFLRAFGRDVLEKPAGIGIGSDDSIWVADFDQDKIFRFDGKGELLDSWGAAGDRLSDQSDDQTGGLDSPADVAVDSKGFVYVVDEYHHQVQKFSADGQFVLAWGKKGKVNIVLSALNFLIPDGHESEFYYPTRIAIDANDHIYVADAYNHRVQVFDAQGVLMQSIGGMGLWGGRFRVASGLAIAPDQSLFVADFYNNRIQQFDQKGNFLAAWGWQETDPNYLHGPTGVAIAHDGSVLVSDWGNHRILRFFSDSGL